MCQLPQAKTPQKMTRQLRPLVEAAVPPGVTRVGFCPLGVLSHLLPSRHRDRVAELSRGGGSAIVLLLPYYAGEFPGRNLARYALGLDYHRVALDILTRVGEAVRGAHPGAEILPFVDSSPLPEVELAVRAGLGFRGRSGQLIAPGLGSMVFVCELVTDLALAGDLPQIPEGCGTCIRCLTACPTGALSPQGVDTARCRSHITQKKGDLTPWEAAQVAQGGFAWGCDLCTDACPYNRDLGPTRLPPLGEGLTPVLTWDNLDRLLPDKSYAWRGRGPLLRNLNLIDKGEL